MSDNEDVNINAKEYLLQVFTNEGPNDPAMSMLMMFVDGVFKNKIGLMRARHSETGELSLIIVGIEPGEGDQVSTYPLARVMSAEESTFYQSPDGVGGYQNGSYQKGMGEDVAEVVEEV